MRKNDPRAIEANKLALKYLKKYFKSAYLTAEDTEVKQLAKLLYNFPLVEAKEQKKADIAFIREDLPKLLDMYVTPALIVGKLCNRLKFLVPPIPEEGA
jgi:hypothetical protein